MLSNGSGQFGQQNITMAPHSGPLLNQLASFTIEESEQYFDEFLCDDSLLATAHHPHPRGLASVIADWQERMVPNTSPASYAVSTGSLSRQSPRLRSAAVEDQNGLSEQYIGKEPVLPPAYAMNHEPWGHDLACISPWRSQALVAPSTDSDPTYSTDHSPQIMNLGNIGLEADECNESGRAEEMFLIPLLGPDLFDLESAETLASHPANLAPPVHSRTVAGYGTNFRHTEDIEYDASTFALNLNGRSVQDNKEWPHERLPEPGETQLPIFPNGDPRDNLQPVPTQIPLLDPQLSKHSYAMSDATNASDLFDGSQTDDWGRTYHDVYDTGNMGQIATNELSRTDHNNMATQNITASASSTSVAAFRCPHTSCSSKMLFTRKCDLDKHYRLHFRKYFCRFPDCESSSTSPNKIDQKPRPSFATMKDRDRHEKGHNPSLPCHICGQLFGRYDNMRNHCRRRHGD
jgi:hypothetical protein